MEAVVLAGGFGTRLRQIVPDVPKPMAPVAGRPFLEIVLGRLANKGFKRVVLSLGYMPGVISGHFGSTFSGMELDYVVEEAPLGTGGGVRLAMERIRADHVFIFNGDTFLDIEADRLEACWHQHRVPIVVGRSVLDTARYGRLLIECGRVLGFTEKGVSGPGLINAGCYVFSRGQLDGFPLMTSFSLENDFLAKVVSKQRFDVFVTEGRFIDIGVPDDYYRAQVDLKDL